MAFYDEEEMIRDAEKVFKDNLDTEIGLINTEKSDSLTLDLIPNDRYIFETLDSRILNYSGFFLMYGIADTPIREQSTDNYIEDLTLTFQVATFDPGEKERNNTLYKLLRYRRALKQVVINNPDIFRSFAKPEISSLKPDAFPYDRKNVILSIGINIKASVTAN